MKYRNKKTGAIIESSSQLGGAWELYEPSKAPVKPKVEEKPVEKEEIIEEITVDNTKKEIMQELDALGVEYNSKMTKAELVELMYKKRW